MAKQGSYATFYFRHEEMDELEDYAVLRDTNKNRIIRALVRELPKIHEAGLLDEL